MSRDHNPRMDGPLDAPRHPPNDRETRHYDNGPRHHERERYYDDRRGFLPNGGRPRDAPPPRDGIHRERWDPRDDRRYRGPAPPRAPGYDPNYAPRTHATRDEGSSSNPNTNNNAAPSRKPAPPEYQIAPQPKDPKLNDALDADPRGADPTQRITPKALHRGTGRNTESFDPASTLVRPDLRIHVGSNQVSKYNKPLKHDDVVIIPELFGAEDDWTMYYQLVKELQELQASNVKGSEWISWHEGAHLISKNPEGSQAFQSIIDRLCEYFNIEKKSIGTRFNWYTDSSDWKPFHHDSAAFNPQRAKTQNITVGVSFGATRELAFIHATPQEDGEKCRVYFPQTNNGVFSFGRDANIRWKHGVNALPPQEQDGKGRISIILWGLAKDVVEEKGSPPLLGSDGHGPHAPRQHDRRRNHREGGGRRDVGGRDGEPHARGPAEEKRNTNGGGHNNKRRKRGSSGSDRRRRDPSDERGVKRTSREER